ncbi:MULTISPECIES: hypothetical protein [Rufibacter]|uniref:Uncharacterized protein n=1 Tax=Rufibacter quisquiliarum TaxID=1549639 RepID=A0A839GQG2_9BACT|nr:MULTISPECIES: hypothetical protein [Rufibacter]MBA9077137.1 hypothetical protein [Rufibacter quisquiliarum]
METVLPALIKLFAACSQPGAQVLQTSIFSRISGFMTVYHGRKTGNGLSPGFRLRLRGKRAANLPSLVSLKSLAGSLKDICTSIFRSPGWRAKPPGFRLFSQEVV